MALESLLTIPDNIENCRLCEKLSGMLASSDRGELLESKRAGA
jgi:hypothetical protein